MLKIFYTVIVLLILISCTKKDPEGQWDDNIHLSTRYVELGYAIDSVTITTQGTGWWLNSVSLNDSSYYFSNPENFDTSNKKWVITNGEFTLERRNSSTLFIKMEENITGADRTLHISFQAGDYFDYVNVKQKGQ